MAKNLEKTLTGLKKHRLTLKTANKSKIPQARTTCYGLETTSFLGIGLWQALPNDMKQSDTLSSFNRRIKTWKRKECKCLMLSRRKL